MKLCERNLKTISYKMYAGQQPILDKDGFDTGEVENSYSDAVEIKANVSPAKGTSSVEPFGVDIEYTNTMIVSDMDCPIDEHSILWIDSSTDKPFTHVVVRVAKGLNYIMYAIRKVT